MPVDQLCEAGAVNALGQTVASVNVWRAEELFGVIHDILPVKGLRSLLFCGCGGFFGGGGR